MIVALFEEGTAGGVLVVGVSLLVIYWGIPALGAKLGWWSLGDGSDDRDFRDPGD